VLFRPDRPGYLLADPVLTGLVGPRSVRDLERFISVWRAAAGRPPLRHGATSPREGPDMSHRHRSHPEVPRAPHRRAGALARKAWVAGACTVGLVLTGAGAAGATPPGHHPGGSGGLPGVQLEHLDRGLVAAATDDGVFLSWRLLAHEVTGYTAGGLTGADFHVYRDGALIAFVTDSTNYLDQNGSGDSSYQVAAVVDGVEVDLSAAVTPWSSNSYDLPLQRPADGVTPVGEPYTYSANDMSVGDVDGDGQYEYIVKWDPSNSKDV